MSEYFKWDGFESIYLEDSFVLKIEESKEEISFKVEVVLTEGHPKYVTPKPNERYCYEIAKIIFKGLKSVEWLDKNNEPFIDANNSEDFGNIDTFELLSGKYHLLGDWGEVLICSEAPILEWLEE